MKKCVKCGFVIENDSAKFCKKCGAKQPEIVEEIKDSKVVDSSSDDGILLNEYNDKPITDDGGRLSLRILQAKNQYAVTILILLTLTKEMGFYGQWKHVSGNMRLLRAEHREASIGTSVSLIVLSLLYCLDLQ